jgi:hypothetical protein
MEYGSCRSNAALHYHVAQGTPLGRNGLCGSLRIPSGACLTATFLSLALRLAPSPILRASTRRPGVAGSIAFSALIWLLTKKAVNNRIAHCFFANHGIANLHGQSLICNSKTPEFR